MLLTKNHAACERAPRLAPKHDHTLLLPGLTFTRRTRARGRNTARRCARRGVAHGAPRRPPASVCVAVVRSPPLGWNVGCLNNAVPTFAALRRLRPADGP